MKKTFLTVAFCAALTAAGLTASAQTKYTEGVLNYTVTAPQGSVDAKSYFKGDSSAYSAQQGPANIKVITANSGEYLAVLVDVPVASIKKAAVATPAEIEEGKAKQPKYTFTPGTETKVISGFKCKKVVVKDDKSGATYEAWVTNDITTPPSMLSYLLKDIGGVPVQFTTNQMGQNINVTLKSVSNEKVPAGAFAIPADFEKITLTDLQSMGGGN